MMKHLPEEMAILISILMVLPQNLSAFTLFPKTDSIRIVYNNTHLILAGESFPIDLLIYKSNGKLRRMSGMLGRARFLYRYKIHVVGGDYLGGKVLVNKRLIPSKGKYIKVEAVDSKNDKIRHKLLLPLNYETELFFHTCNNYDKAPGAIIKGMLISVFNNGMQRIYSNLKSEKDAGNFHFASYGGDWSKGSFFLNPDFRKIKNHQCALVVSSRRNVYVKDTFLVNLDYKKNYKISFSGHSGWDGGSGFDGSAGSSGSDGQDGGPGGDGQLGEDGPDVDVWCDLYYDSLLQHQLLYVIVENRWTHEEKFFLLNPDGASIRVKSIGGHGGDGGRGGDGGDGGPGIDGSLWYENRTITEIEKQPRSKIVIKKEKMKVINSEGKEEEIEIEVKEKVTYYVDVEVKKVIKIAHRNPGEDGGDGGWGGSGGIGAPGGYGGNITLFITNDALPFQGLIIASSLGGSGGMHGHGGDGGRAGFGGRGEPDGRDGISGQSGPYALGWAEDGAKGDIRLVNTEEFVFYE